MRPFARPKRGSRAWNTMRSHGLRRTRQRIQKWKKQSCIQRVRGTPWPTVAHSGAGTLTYLVKVGRRIEACMAGLPSEVDVAVIGAGAAGIAAARRLAGAQRASFVVIEARERA